ncbi:MAG: peptidase [Nevskia sp.]|nr:peptidase [Nevskia sp.]
MNPIRYRIAAAEPHAHLFQVRCEMRAPAAAQVFALPSWIRGSYLVRDFAKHVVSLRAESNGRELPIERIDKRSFRVDSKGAPLTLDYSVYAYDASVRKAYLDARRGFFNASSLCYCPQGFEASDFELEIVRPDTIVCARWKLATTLHAVAVDDHGFGRYRAGCYEELIDNPVEMAEFQRIDFDVDGIAHAFVLSGRCEVDTARLADDVGRICHVQREMFGQEPNAAVGFDRYVFLTQVTGNGYGGLEHRRCSALVTARDALPRPGQAGLRKGYRGFLGLVSHEYFHLWNVKRITPAPFAASDLRAEAYSRDLWAYEGVTSYYDDLMLLRAGILDAPAYLDLLAENATRLSRAPGRLLQTLADASFEAWIKYYQSDENTPNQAVNYYVKGALAALCVDLKLRRDSKTTLDDVMRGLWDRYGRDDRPVPERGLEMLAGALSGLDLHGFFDRLLRSTEELPLVELLADFGVHAQARVAHGAGDVGGRVNGKSEGLVTLGLTLRAADTGIAQVLASSPAARAGLAAGDTLLALDGLRVTAANWSKTLETLLPGRAVDAHFFRGDELLSARIVPELAPADTWTLTLAEATGAALARRNAWLATTIEA